jgi:DegV family protein with EDD domain
VGTMLDIKPILTLTKAGKLEAHSKVQGRKKAMKALAEKVADFIENPQDQTVIVFHGDSHDEAEILKTQIKNRVPDIKEIKLQMIGPVIGAHAGPGTLAVCFMGRERPM